MDFLKFIIIYHKKGFKGPGAAFNLSNEKRQFKKILDTSSLLKIGPGF
jgi:hypothetical protein|tara:strand:+ start:188 stop:331 length:144 start_codon:yes stop_codon:yes gene_type:complete